MSHIKKAIFIYEPEQIPVLEQVLSQTRDGFAVVALGLDVEFELEKRGIEFLSGRGLRKTSTPERMMHIDAVVEKLVTELGFFSYCGVPLGRVFAPTLTEYLLRVHYYADMIAAFTLKYPDIEQLCVLGTTVRVLETAGVLGRLEADAVVEAARCGTPRGVPVSIIECSSAATETAALSFRLKRAVFGAAIYVLNVALALLPRRKITVLATEYWRDIAPLVSQLPEVEWCLLDRTEATNAGLVNILKGRMRFYSLDRSTTARMRRIAHEQARLFTDKYTVAVEKGELSVAVSLGGVSIEPAIRTALKRLMEAGGYRGVCFFESAAQLIRRLRPQVVFVRTSVGAQPHFAILCYAAAEAGVPSLEQQHGIEYYGDGSLTRTHAAKFLSVYGELIAARLEEIGYESERVFALGSARFDEYSKGHTNTAGTTALVIGPGMQPGFWTDSYDIYDYFCHAAAAVQAVPGATVLARPRATPLYAHFYAECILRAFHDMTIEWSLKESLRDAYDRAHVAISCYSTVIYEAFAYRMPTIFPMLLPMQAVLGVEFRSAAEAGALPTPTDASQFADTMRGVLGDAGNRTRLADALAVYTAKKFEFDGGSSGRLAQLIRSLAGDGK